jgi:hypothetical protein
MVKNFVVWLKKQKYGSEFDSMVLKAKVRLKKQKYGLKFKSMVTSLIGSNGVSLLDHTFIGCKN